MYVRANDVAHGVSLQKLGATVVVPEMLEPSLQLAAAVLANEFAWGTGDVADCLDNFR